MTKQVEGRTICVSMPVQVAIEGLIAHFRHEIEARSRTQAPQGQLESYNRCAPSASRKYGRGGVGLMEFRMERYPDLAWRFIELRLRDQRSFDQV